MKRVGILIFSFALLAAGTVVLRSGTQVTFAPPATYFAGYYPYFVTVEDLDRDGDPDMVVGDCSEYYEVVLFWNNGSGLFTRTTLTAGKTPEGVTTCDINLDGWPDIITANHSENSVSVFLGDGAGSFGPKTDFPTGDLGPYHVTTGDINSDGKPDLAIAHFGTGATRAVIMLNTTPPGSSSLSFGTSTSLNFAGRQWGVTLGDLNLDGKLDLVVPTEYSGLAISLGDGSGGFGPPSYPGHPAIQAEICDLNRDGKPDLALASGNRNPPAVLVLLGNGSGSFGSAAVFPIAGYPTSIDSGDLNGDGKPDLLVGCGISGAVVLLGDGLGSFPITADLSSGSNCRSVAIQDFNRDGKADAAVVSEAAQSLYVFRNTTTFAPSGQCEAGITLNFGGRQWGVTLGDLNLDGKLDLVVPTESSGLAISLGDGSGGFGPPSYPGHPAIQAEICDLNRDGKPDLALASGNRNPPAVLVLLGNGSGSFGSAAVFPIAGYPTSIDSGDLNSDGKPDLLVGCGISGAVVLFGDGLGGFPITADLSTGSNCRSVAIQDFNHDGKADAAVVSEAAQSLYILFGDGMGGFSPPSYYYISYFPYFMTAEDFDRDGDLDMLVGDCSDYYETILFWNNGSGLFTRTTLTAGKTPEGVVTCDLNRDGSPDIITVNYSANSVSVFLGDGAGGFGAKTDFTTGDLGPYCVTSGDVNNDGKPDLAVAHFGIGATTVRIFLNSPYAAPTAEAGPNQVLSTGEISQFDGSASTGAIATYSWDFGDGSTATGAQVEHAYSSKGEFTVTLTVTSPEGATGRDTAIVKVDNTAPVANGQSAIATGGVNGGLPVEIVLSGFDAENDALSFTLVGPPSHGSLSGVPPHLTYQSGPSYAGPDSFTFKVNDGRVDSASAATVAINVKLTLVFPGFESPIDSPPTVNSAKAGATVPVKWRITDFAGTPVSDPATFKGLTSYAVNCGTLSGEPADEVEEYSAGASGLQYLGDGRWQFNWKTLKSYARQCRIMVLTLADGSTHQASFKFK